MQISHTSRQSTRSGLVAAHARQESIHRFLFWHGFFYLELVTVTGATVWIESESLVWGSLALLLGLTLLLGVWYGICIIVPSIFWRQHPLVTQGYLVCTWGFWLVLEHSHPAYLLMLFGLSSQVYLLSYRLWKIPGILILSTFAFWYLLVITRINYSVLLIFASLVVVGFPVSLSLEAINQQNREKDQLLHELEATRQELAVASRHAGAMQERQRLAHEIHDTLAQGFTSILMHVEAVRGARPDDMHMVSRHLDYIHQAARENLTEARRLMWALQPEALERTSLPEVLTHLSEKWSAENGIGASTTITGPGACSVQR